MPDWWKISKPDGDCTRVDLYDEIGMPDSERAFLDEFQKIKSPKIDLHINSDGGEVTCGMAIYNAIKAHSSHVTAIVDGLAASIASVIALAADKIIMRPQSFMVIHNPHQLAMGDSESLRGTADKLYAMSSMIAGVYAEKTKKPIDEIKQAMNREAWFPAAEAKAYGFCDEVSGSSNPTAMGMAAMNAVLRMDRVPKQIRQQAERMVAQLTTENPMPTPKVFQKDGKHFVEIDGKPIEVTLSPAPEATNHIAQIDTAALKAQIDSAKADGQKAEREYREMFDTVVATAKLEGEQLTQFTKLFYGQSKDVLSFHATNLIAGRATPVGGGGTAPDGGAGGDTEEQKAFAKLKKDAQAEFRNRRDLRRMFKCENPDPESPEYKAAFDRFFRVEVRNAADTRNPKGEPSGDGDPVSRILKNQNVLMNVPELAAK